MASGYPRVLTLSPTERLILDLLVGEQEMYGLQLVAASHGRLKRGTVYVTLGRMEDKGFVAAHLEPPPAAEGGMPRPVYRATALGRRVLSVYAHADRRPLVPEFVP